MKAVICQHTLLELNPLWNSKPEEFTEQCCYMIRPPHEENQPSSGINDRLEPVHDVIRNATQYRVAVVDLADHESMN